MVLADSGQHQCLIGPLLFSFCRLYNWAIDLNTRDGPLALFRSMLHLLFVTVVLPILICCFQLVWLMAGYRMRHERSSGTMFGSCSFQLAMGLCMRKVCRMQVRRKPTRIQTPVTWLQIRSSCAKKSDLQSFDGLCRKGPSDPLSSPLLTTFWKFEGLKSSVFWVKGCRISFFKV